MKRFTLTLKHILYQNTDATVSTPSLQESISQRVPKDFAAAFIIYKRKITIILNAKINVTEIEAREMGLFITFPLGEFQTKLFFKMHLTMARITVPGI